MKLLTLAAVFSCSLNIKQSFKVSSNDLVNDNYKNDNFDEFKKNFQLLNKEEQEQMLIKAVEDNKNKYIEYLLSLDINPFISSDGVILDRIIKDDYLKARLKSKQLDILIINCIKEANIKVLKSLNKDLYKRKDNEGNDIIDKIFKVLDRYKNKEFITKFFEEYIKFHIDCYDEGSIILRKIVMGDNLEILKVLLDGDKTYANYIDISILEDIILKKMYKMFEYLLNNVHIKQENLKTMSKHKDENIAKLVSVKLKNEEAMEEILQEIEKSDPSLIKIKKILDNVQFNKENIKQMRRKAVLEDKSEYLVELLSLKLHSLELKDLNIDKKEKIIEEIEKDEPDVNKIKEMLKQVKLSRGDIVQIIKKAILVDKLEGIIDYLIIKGRV